MTARARSYHHGRLREAAMEAALDEVGRVGAAGVSMREIARRAGVTHAALAYQFGDKAGLFTAIATAGFRLAAAAIGPVATGPNGFIQGGIAYIAFALAHPAHFEVMFRPDLHRAADPELVEARNAAFAILYGGARDSLNAGSEEDVTGVVVAGWSLSHGFAGLAGTGNLSGRIGDDPAELPTEIATGLVRIGELARVFLETQSTATESRPPSRRRQGASTKPPRRATPRANRTESTVDSP